MLIGSLTTGGGGDGWWLSYCKPAWLPNGRPYFKSQHSIFLKMPGDIFSAGSVQSKTGIFHGKLDHLHPGSWWYLLSLDFMALLLCVIWHFSTSLFISQGINYASWWKVAGTFRLPGSDGLSSVFLLILLFKAHFNDCRHSRDVARWHMEFIFGVLRARLEQWDVKETNISTETTLAFCSE